MTRDLNEKIRKESNNNDDEGGEVEVGVPHQGCVDIVIHSLASISHQISISFLFMTESVLTLTRKVSTQKL